jgi:large subunit ribosomal protein L9
MEIILRKDIDELGLEGDIVNVARGYGRNYLIPQGLAVPASAQNIKLFETQKKKIELKRLKATEEAEKVKEAISQKVITFILKSGEEGKLYGSVTSMDIASRLEQEGIVVDRKKIVLDKPIKTLGEFSVPIRIYRGVRGSVQVHVEPEAQA